MGMKIIRYTFDVFLDTDAKFSFEDEYDHFSNFGYKDLVSAFLKPLDDACESIHASTKSIMQVAAIDCLGDVTDEYPQTDEGLKVLNEFYNNIVTLKSPEEMSESEKDFVNNHILKEYSAKIDSLKDPLTYHEIDLLIEHWSDVFVWPHFVVKELMDYARMPKATFLSPTPVVNTKTREHVSPLELAVKKLMFNMADEDSSYENIYFDEFYYDEENEVYWTGICDKCASKYDIPMKFIDKNSGDGICGIYGCLRKADHYIDMPEDMCKLRGDM